MTQINGVKRLRTMEIVNAFDIQFSSAEFDLENEFEPEIVSLTS